MDFIVDANVIFSALVTRSVNLDVMRSLYSSGSALYVPEYLFEEIERKEETIVKESGLSPTILRLWLRVISRMLKTVSRSGYEPYLSHARALSPHPKDDPYFALALSLGCGIWSGEKKFKHQSEVPVYTTTELKSMV